MRNYKMRLKIFSAYTSFASNRELLTLVEFAFVKIKSRQSSDLH